MVEASAEGNEDIIKLGDEVGKLATKADKVAPEFAALAAEIAKLGQQQAAITGFERLKAAGQTIVIPQTCSSAFAPFRSSR